MPCGADHLVSHLPHLCPMQPRRCHSPRHTQSCTRFLQRWPLQPPPVLAAPAAAPLTSFVCLPFSLSLPVPPDFVSCRPPDTDTLWSGFVPAEKPQVPLLTCPPDPHSRGLFLLVLRLWPCCVLGNQRMSPLSTGLQPHLLQWILSSSPQAFPLWGILPQP